MGDATSGDGVGSSTDSITTIDPMTTGSIFVMRTAQGTTEDDEGATNVMGGVRTLGIFVGSANTTSSALIDPGQNQIVYNHGAVAGSFYATYTGNGTFSGSLDASATLQLRVLVDEPASPCTITVTLADAANNSDIVTRTATSGPATILDIPASLFTGIDFAAISRIRIEFSPASTGGNVITGPFTIAP